MAHSDRTCRYAVRSLRQQPAFTAMAVAMLAIGIGATVAMFSLTFAVLLKPLPFADPDRLMLVHLLAPGRDTGRRGRMIWSYPKYQVFRDHQRAFDSTATLPVELEPDGSGAPERVTGELVDATYFSTLARTADRPAPSRQTKRGRPARRAGHSRPRFLDDAVRRGASVVGRTVGLNGTPHTIIGVMPAGFRGLTGKAICGCR